MGFLIMDYLKILNVLNNTGNKKPVEKPVTAGTQKEIKVSIVISTTGDYIPNIEIESIAKCFRPYHKLVSIYILHTNRKGLKGQANKIMGISPVLKRIVNPNHFNINLIDDILQDTADYIIYSKDDVIINAHPFIYGAIKLMESDSSIAKVDSKSYPSQYTELSDISNSNGIAYHLYKTNKFSTPGEKPGRIINISNYKGFDFNPGVLRCEALSILPKDHVFFYDLNAFMVQNNKRAVCLNQIGFEKKDCSTNMKTSFIMQSFLGDYPGSRTNSVPKFHRAIESVLNNKNSEIIVVSDGCVITDNEIKKYAGNDRVKYAYVSKTKNRMYESNDNKTFFRGVPRQVGIELATGDLITYMDSDDYMMPAATEIITAEFYKSDLKHLFNIAWYDHEKSIEYHVEMKGHHSYPERNLKLFNNTFIEAGIQEGNIHFAPWLHVHVPDIDVKWKDVYGTISEDVVFVKALIESLNYTSGFISIPYYVRCHLKDYFDV